MSIYFTHTSWRLPAAGLAAASIALILLGTPPMLSSAPLALPFMPTPTPSPDMVQLTVEDLTRTAYPTITYSGEHITDLYRLMRTQPRDSQQRDACPPSPNRVTVSFLSRGKIIFEGKIVPACGSIESQDGIYNITESFRQTLLSVSDIWVPNVNED